jgi:hypothetical protein
MLIKKFESFNEFEDLESDVELLMQGLIEKLNLKKFEDGPDVEPDDPVNGYFSYGINNTDGFITYLFITEDPFDTESSNSDMLNNTIDKIKFIQRLLEEISKVTNRLDKFGYQWRLIHYSGDSQLGLFIYNKSNPNNRQPETEAQLGEYLESFSSESNDLVNCINNDKFEDLLSNNNIEKITDGEIDKIKYLIDSVDSSIIIKHEKLKRFRGDEFESCVSFDMKYGKKNGVGYIVFYKFEDGWWMIEMCTNNQASFSRNQHDKQRKVQTWIIDSIDGIKKWTETILQSI